MWEDKWESEKVALCRFNTISDYVISGLSCILIAKYPLQRGESRAMGGISTAGHRGEYPGMYIRAQKAVSMT